MSSEFFDKEERHNMIKKLISALCAAAMIFSLTACAGAKVNETKKTAEKETETSAKATVESTAKPEETENLTKDGKAKKACYITNSPLGNEFTDSIWNGFKAMESDGWEVKSIEVSEEGEYAEQIRAMADQGYTAIFTMFDEVSDVAVSLADELKEKYPDLHIFMLDTYMDHGKDNCTSISVDPFESSFVAGYIAANMTETGTVGWIGHSDILKIWRFRDGFIAGVNYADNGTKVVTAFTGDYKDPVKGQETATAMIKENPVDIIYQCDYLGGTGVIAACADAGIKCIGVDDWKGDIDDCVFWSAVKAMDVAVESVLRDVDEGREFPKAINFDLSAGGRVYDDRDWDNIPKDLQQKVTDLIAGIKSGDIDVYEGFDEYRLNY
ncbi:MAG: BMP family ABC transporter substrate-binding protein [Candidatus Avilachnospira sp.]|jgi:basic membrane protein A